MWALTQLLAVYIFGGLTFLPLLVCLVFLHAYLAFPTRTLVDNEDARVSLQRPGDEGIPKSVAGDFEKFGRPRGHEPDVAAGYFAVCREYVPGGINGKPPERTTPAGTVVIPESPSVYQSMYRSIFDRKQSPSLDAAKGAKRARNVFFVVLRHGHLMLYDDSEQLEVRHVISLAHHNVSIYGPGDSIPDGELWIRRNAICLTRKGDAGELMTDGSATKPFYLFSENCSDKEDFYFALLQNQDQTLEANAEAPKPLQFEVKDIIGLVQRLHSSEEHWQTRWINGLAGRLFLALYKTSEIENAVRMKIAKKISRVKRPNFLSDIVLQKIDMGEGAPYITNPRLKDLTVNGDCSAEMDLNYTGNFRIEVAATARIDLGSRFKAREVNLVLAVVIKKLEGHFIVRFKPPPSNRIWITFETMPKIEMSIEPIVSTRQITYNIILRAIESRIREVVAETLVLPHWDDIPFTDTMQQHFRGGIWANDKSKQTPKDVAASDEAEKEETEGSVEQPGLSALGSREKSMSTPVLPVSTPTHMSSTHSLGQVNNDGGISSAVETRIRAGKPRSIRSGSFTSAVSPLVSMDATNVDAVRERKEGERQNAAAVMMAISSRSRPVTPTDSPVGSPSRASTIISEGSRSSSGSSKEDSADTESAVAPPTAPPKPLANPSDSNSDSPKPLAAFGNDSNRSGPTLSLAHPPSPQDKRHSVSSISSAATAAAKKWGWGVLSRNNESRIGIDGPANIPKEGSPTQPVGRGRPLPPPGIPLPPPEKNRNKSNPVNVPKRKNLPPPLFPQRQNESDGERRSVPLPPLPPRPAGELPRANERDDGLLVVAAPPDSEPTTPLDDTRDDFIHPMELGDAVNNELESNVGDAQEHGGRLGLHPRSNPRQTDGEVSGLAGEDEAEATSSWQAAQEAEARSKSIWGDTDNGHS
ncbi:MAG: hypothetical protein M1839_006362 [Geoglossum umbratile]|nr:MAG: hypothetical protein M1839_006362 [Geoglossum umbratile]